VLLQQRRRHPARARQGLKKFQDLDSISADLNNAKTMLHRHKKMFGKRENIEMAGNTLYSTPRLWELSKWNECVHLFFLSIPTRFLKNVLQRMRDERIKDL
jgi:hypothetical protein